MFCGTRAVIVFVVYVYWLKSATSQYFAQDESVASARVYQPKL